MFPDNLYAFRASPGPWGITIAVNDGTNPIQGAAVGVSVNGQTQTLHTDVNGHAVFSLSLLTYTVAIVANGFTFNPTTLSPTCTATVTYSMTAFTPTESGPGLATGWLSLPNAANTPITYQYVNGGNIANVSHDPITVMANGSGYVQMPLIIGAIYIITVSANDVFQTLVPNADTFQIEPYLI